MGEGMLCMQANRKDVGVFVQVLPLRRHRSRRCEVLFRPRRAARPERILAASVENVVPRGGHRRVREGPRVRGILDEGAGQIPREAPCGIL